MKLRIMKYIFVSEMYDASKSAFYNDYSLISDLFDKGNNQERINEIEKIFKLNDEDSINTSLKNYEETFARYYKDFHNLLTIDEIDRYNLYDLKKNIIINSETYENYDSINYVNQGRHIIYSAEIYTQLFNIIDNKNIKVKQNKLNKKD